MKYKTISIINLAICLIFSLPIVIILAFVFLPFEGNSDVVFSHIAKNFLPSYFYNSVLLIILTVFLVFIFIIPIVFLLQFYNFWGRRWLKYALILPLFIPAYISAFLYGSFFEYAGWVQSFFRQIFNIKQGEKYFFPEIRSIGGAAFVFAFNLLPYLYLVISAYLKNQAGNIFEVAKTLGKNNRQIFLLLYLPLIKPALMFGAILIMMEILSDFGVVSLYNIHSFTTGIYKSWLSFNNLQVAIKLAAMLLLIVACVMLLKVKFKDVAVNFQNNANNYRLIERENLYGLRACLAFILCFVPVLLGFLLPMGLMINNIFSAGEILTGGTGSNLVTGANLAIGEDFATGAVNIMKNSFNLLIPIFNSFKLGIITCFLMVLLAFFVIYLPLLSNNSDRNFPSIKKSKLYNLIINLLKLGYSVPGSVIAITTIMVFILVKNNFGINLTNSIFALVYVYTIRFTAVLLSIIQPSEAKTPHSFYYVSQTLGNSHWQYLQKIATPLQIRAFIYGAMLVFIEVIKELPASIMLRPFDMPVSSVIIYDYASDDRIIEASLHSFFLIISLAILFLVSKIIIKRPLYNRYNRING